MIPAAMIHLTSTHPGDSRKVTEALLTVSHSDSECADYQAYGLLKMRVLANSGCEGHR